MSLDEISEETFACEVLQSDLPVLVDFWAEWCAPCRGMEPILERVAKAHAGRLRVAKLDVQEHPNVAVNYGVNNLPTLLLFVDGEVAERLAGYMPEPKIVERVAPYLR